MKNYEEYYDPATKTLTVTFGDSLIAPGEEVTSLVSVTFSDGSVGESTEVLRTPDFSSLDLSISHNTTDCAMWIFSSAVPVFFPVLVPSRI